VAQCRTEDIKQDTNSNLAAVQLDHYSPDVYRTAGDSMSHEGWSRFAGGLALPASASTSRLPLRHINWSCHSRLVVPRRPHTGPLQRETRTLRSRQPPCCCRRL